MSKRLLTFAGILILALVAIAVWSLGFQGNDTSAVDKEITRLVKAYDDAIYIDRDRNAAKKAANEMIALADQSANPNGTKARGIIRIPYANIVTGKWDGRWRKKVQECESLISDEPSVERAELLLYSGHLMGKWGKHEFEAGLKQVQEALQIAHHLQDDRTLALAYTFSTELQMFMGRPDSVAKYAYRAVSVANSHKEKSIKVVTLRNLIAKMSFHGNISEASNAGEMLLEIIPDSEDSLYPLFVTRKSEKLEEFVQLLAEQFDNQPVDRPNRRSDRARLGKWLTKLGRAYFVRKEFSKCCETMERALPHVEAVNDRISLSSCLAFSEVAKLDNAVHAGNVDEVAAKFNEKIITEFFATAFADAYAKFGEKEKSLDWRERASILRDTNYSKAISRLRRSSELYWESELNLREQSERNNKKDAESRARIWFLRSALAIGLTAIVLLSGFSYLSRLKSISLEDVVKERTRSLSEATQKANAADLAKSDFLAQVNHEIRNPLTAILGYCELLSLEKKEPNEFVAGIESSSLHLRDLVDKILEVSKIESSGPEVQIVKFLPVQTANDIRGIMAEKARKHGLDFECTFIGDPNCLISSDETKIRQIGLNLIGNAVKFTEQGRVTASFELTTFALSSRAELVIDVNDTGVGIEESQSEAVFERFTKAGKRATRDGSGLGLFIVKRLVHCMAGEITLESTLGVGTHVRVTLPVEIADVPSSAPATPTQTVEFRAPENPSAYSGRRILVIDDQEIIRNSLELQFQAYGLDCKAEWELVRTIERVENLASRPCVTRLENAQPFWL